MTIISVYIILNVGLGWFWAIGSCENANRVNQVLLNLSYSYIAGCIFYLLVTYFPEMQRKKTLRPAIKLKIEDLRKQINACIQTFEKNEDWNLIDNISKEQLTNLIMNANMYDNSYYAKTIGYTQNHLQFLHATRDNVFAIIEQILSYKEYLSAEQLLLIEKIHDSTYFHLTKVYENTPVAMMFYSSDKYKLAMISDLYDIIIHMRKLLKTY